MRQKEDDVEYKVLARGEDAMPSDDANVLQDYFNAGTSLRELAQIWASKDPRFCNVHPYFPGKCFWSIKSLVRGLKDAMPSDDADVLQDYFNAGTRLGELHRFGPA